MDDESFDWARAPYVRAADGILTQRTADDMVLLDLQGGLYYGLDQVGTRMFELSCQLPDADGVVAQLASEYEAEEPVLLSDLEALLDQLVEKGLVVRARPRTDAGAGPSGDASAGPIRISRVKSVEGAADGAARE